MEIYVATGDIDGAVAVQVCLTLDDCDSGSTRNCEVCQREVLGETFYPHTFESDYTGIALCLPCQFGQVADGIAVLMGEETANVIFAESTGKHAAA